MCQLQGEVVNIILPANDFLDDGCEHLTEMFVLFDEEDVDDKDVEADIGKVRSPSRRIFVRLGNTIWPKIPLLDFLVKLYFLCGGLQPHQKKQRTPRRKIAQQTHQQSLQRPKMPTTITSHQN